jgi:2-oxoisovalerate dehydrogenase E1 component
MEKKDYSEIKSSDSNVSLSNCLKDEEVTREQVADWLRSICEIRFFEDKVYELLSLDIIKGASHLYAGQEAVAVGAIAAIEKGDVIGSTHRGHGHCGAIGNKYAETEQERQEHWNRMMAELMGKETGYCKGRGGSMHIADVEKCNNLGSTGIVGGNIPPTVGAALAEKYKKSGRVVVSFFGDGASNTGAFHEALNLASVLELPLVAIAENNLYGMSVPFSGSPVEGTRRAAKIRDIADRAQAYGIIGQVVDGQNVLSVYLAVKNAVAHARTKGPVLVEAKTYRWYGHSRSDPRKYRTRAEEQQWRDRDPISVLSSLMIEEGSFSEEEVEAIKKKAHDTIEIAAKFAMESPFPDPKDLTKDVYVEIDYDSSVMHRDRDLSRKVNDLWKEAEQRLAQKPENVKKSEWVKMVDKEFRETHGLALKTIVQAIVEAQVEEMERDEDIILFGEDVGLYGGAYGASKGLLEKFGVSRVIDTPISEAAIAGAGVGAALRGLRPIVEIMYVDFITLAMDQLVHNGAYNRYMFGGKTKVPMVLRTEGGLGRCIAAHHSESLEAWLMHVPGLHVVMPSTPYDAKGLLKAAIRSDNPVVYIEHKAMYGQQGLVPLEDYIIPIGAGDKKREGKDVTIVAYSRMVHFSLKAAEKLSSEHGIEAEVIDLRTLKPLDIELVARSVHKTGKLITVSEGFPYCGAGREVVGQLFEYRFPDGTTGFDYLDARPVNLAAADVPPPMSEPLEDASVPSPESIIEAVKQLV